MKKCILKNKVFLKIMIILLVFGFLGGAYIAFADDSNKPLLKISSEKNNYEIKVNDEFDVNLTITPPTLNKTDINKSSTKEIVLVVDTSGSMTGKLDNTTRILAMQKAAKEFIEKFAEVDNVKIGIVSYSYNAKQQLNGQLVSTKNKMINGKLEDNQNKLKTCITNLKADGATNIGDGIRVARDMLLKGESDAKKYLVLMSDGMPTTLTYTGKASNERLESVSGYSNVYRWNESTTKTGWNYYKGGNETFKYGNYGDRDPKGFCLEYSVEMAKLLKDSNKRIANYVIGFSGGSDSSKLTKIADAGEGSYYDARDAQAITNVYKDIADKIKADYSVENVKINFKVPNILEYSNNNFDTVYNEQNQTYSKFIPNIEYKYDSNTQTYSTQPITVTLKFKGKAAGIDNDLFKEGFLTYKYLNGNEATVKLPKDIKVKVNSFKADIAISRKLRPEKPNNEFNLNDEFEIEYNINPSEFVIDKTEKPKEIILVVDTSYSMSFDINGNSPLFSGEESRLNLTKDAISKFLIKFRNVNNVRIGLVTYNNKADVFMDNQDYLFESNELGKIENKVKQLSIPIWGFDKSTNIGDGIRKAAWALSQNKDSEKYMVFMTDGEPTAYSYIKNNQDYFYTQIDNNDSGIEYYTSLQVNTNSIEYSKLMATILKENKDISINSFFIGFSRDSDLNLLQELGKITGGDCTNAITDNNALNKVYNDIADEIKADLFLDVSFTQTLPNGLVSAEAVDNKISKNFKIKYIYRDGKYVPEPVENITVKVKGTQPGPITLKNDATLSYRDLDGTDTIKTFKDLDMNILGDFIIKQGLFQPNGNNPSNTHAGLKYIREIDSPELTISPNMEYQIGTFIKTSVQKTDINIKLNFEDVNNASKINVTSVNIYSVKEDGSLEKVSTITPNIENNNSISPIIKITFGQVTSAEYRHYIVNYNYNIDRTDEIPDNSNIIIINKASIFDTKDTNELRTRLVNMPDVF